MLPGYNFIYRDSPAHEPQIVGTRLTVTTVANELNTGTTLDRILELWAGSVSREMLEEAQKYYAENRAEIDRYIEESKRSSGTIIRKK